jgi:hypothetical protein
MNMIDNQQKQWEPEPPPEDGYEVVKIVPYGEGATEMAEDLTTLSRDDKELTDIMAFGAGLELSPEDMTSIQYGGLRSDGYNLILERRTMRKEVQDEIKRIKIEMFHKQIDELIGEITAPEQGKEGE